MKAYAKGRRAEYRAQRILEGWGYQTLRAASSKGPGDIAAFGGYQLKEDMDIVRLISIKAGSVYCSKAERERLSRLAMVGRNFYTVEIWRFPDRCREPLIEVL